MSEREAIENGGETDSSLGHIRLQPIQTFERSVQTSEPSTITTETSVQTTEPTVQTTEIARQETESANNHGKSVSNGSCRLSNCLCLGENGYAEYVSNYPKSQCCRGPSLRKSEKLGEYFAEIFCFKSNYRYRIQE